MQTTNFFEAVKSLKANESFEFTYSNITWAREPAIFTLKARKGYKNDEIEYSISNLIESMNVSSITKKYVSLYTFNMMLVQSTFKMNVTLINLI